MTVFEAIVQAIKTLKPEHGWTVIRATRRKLIMHHAEHGERVVSFGNGAFKIRGQVP